MGPTSLLCHGQLSVTNPGCVTTTRIKHTQSFTTTASRAGVASEKTIHPEKNKAADLVPHKPDGAHGLGWLGGAGPVCLGGGAAVGAALHHQYHHHQLLCSLPISSDLLAV